MTKTEQYHARNVSIEVKRAISKYCKEEGITHAKYLKDDKRIKKFLSTGKS